VSIAPFLSRQAFDPEAIQILSKAYESICSQLGLSDRADQLTEIVAKHVIEAGQRGIRNPIAIRLAVLEQLAPKP
jgi:hypothetical protein